MEIKGLRWIPVIIILLLVGLVGYQLGEGKDFPVKTLFEEGVNHLNPQIEQIKVLIADYYELDEQVRKC